jgi:tetratricopeptide (TPR) repeat protein
MLLATVTKPSRGEAQPPARRDPATVGDVELELILNKVREGDLRSMRDDAEGARRAWQEARRLGKGLWPVHEGLGDSFARAKRHDDAVREYAVAEKLVPERHAALRRGIAFKRAEALAAAGRPLDALRGYLALGDPAGAGAKILEQALRAPPEEAVRALRERAEIHDPRVFRLLAEYFERTRRPSEAAEALAEFCTAAAPWDEALNRRAIDGLRAARKFDRAVEVCRAWARSSPQALAAYQAMGDVYREAGREREALVAYTSLVDVRPGDAAVHRLLGDLLKGMGRLDDAIGQYEAARKARPEDPAAYTSLLSAYQAKGDSARVDEVLHEGTKRFGVAGEFRARLLEAYQERIAKLKAEGRGEEVRALRRKLADLGVAEGGLFDLKIIVTWDAACDVDLDVIEPGGSTVNHGNPSSKSGGRYSVDVIPGYGPETYTIKEAVPGTYRVGAHLHGGTRTTVKFVVLLYEDTPREVRREETLVLDGSSGPRFIPDVVVPR